MITVTIANDGTCGSCAKSPYRTDGRYIEFLLRIAISVPDSGQTNITHLCKQFSNLLSAQLYEKEEVL